MTEQTMNTGWIKVESIVSILCLIIMVSVAVGWLLAVFATSAMVSTLLIGGGMILAWPQLKNEQLTKRQRYATVGGITFIGISAIVVGVLICLG